MTAAPFNADMPEGGEFPPKVQVEIPSFDLIVRSTKGGRMIFDAFRQKYVRLTPEEWIRQHFLEYLVRVCRYPASLIAVELAFQYQKMQRRADIVVHDRIGMPFLMAECKAQDVKIVQSTFDQVSRYNRVIGARYLSVTNGISHYCWQVDAATGTYRFLNGIPQFSQMD